MGFVQSERYRSVCLWGCVSSRAGPTFDEMLLLNLAYDLCIPWSSLWSSPQSSPWSSILFSPSNVMESGPLSRLLSSTWPSPWSNSWSSTQSSPSFIQPYTAWSDPLSNTKRFDNPIWFIQQKLNSDDKFQNQKKKSIKNAAKINNTHCSTHNKGKNNDSPWICSWMVGAISVIGMYHSIIPYY